MGYVGLVPRKPLSVLAHELTAHSSTTPDLPFIVLLYFVFFGIFLLAFRSAAALFDICPDRHAFISTSPSSQTYLVYTAPFSYGRLCFNCIRHITILCFCQRPSCMLMFSDSIDNQNSALFITVGEIGDLSDVCMNLNDDWEGRD